MLDIDINTSTSAGDASGTASPQDASRRRGRNAFLSDEEVIAAGCALEARGIQRITGNLLKTQLGGVGRADRYATIWNEHLQQRSSAGQVVAAQPSEQSPQVDLAAGLREIVDRTQGSMLTVIAQELRSAVIAADQHGEHTLRQAVVEADERARQAQEDLETQVRLADEQMGQLQDEIQRLTDDLETAQGARATAEKQAEQAQGAAGAMKAAMDAAEQASRTAQAEVATLTQRLETSLHAESRLNDEVTRLRDELVQARVDARDAARHASEQITALTAQLDAARIDSGRAADRAAEQINALNAQLTTMRADAKQSADRLHVELSEANRKLRELEHVAGERDALQLQLQRAEAAQATMADALASAVTDVQATGTPTGSDGEGQQPAGTEDEKNGT